MHGEITNKKPISMTRTLSTNLDRVKTKLTADLALPSWITNHVFNKKNKNPTKRIRVN